MDEEKESRSILYDIVCSMKDEECRDKAIKLILDYIAENECNKNKKRSVNYGK